MPTIKIPITTDFIELNQLLKLAGLASSGGGGKALVAAGGITVDGAAELRKTAKIHAGQVVMAGEARIRVIAAAATTSAEGRVAVGVDTATPTRTKSPAKTTVNPARRPAWAGKTIRLRGK